ncbi:MAG TPA: hypothetical protein VNB23_01280 [Ramlibacter sp.]|nr:hypothetical protein [Ramlibacter sp.]
MPEDRTPIDHGLAHPQPERGRIPQPNPQADDDQSELVPNQRTVSEEAEKEAARRSGRDNFARRTD